MDGFRQARLFVCATAFFGAALLPAFGQAPVPTDPWPSLVSDVFQDRPMQDGAGIIALDAPTRAEDAALVPMKLQIGLSPDDPRKVRKITLVIDENPAPVAAVFELGPQAAVRSLETRVRIDAYTKVHAVAELSDGKLYVAERYVKAAGGCSAPAVKNLDEANAGIGEMRFREMPEAAGDPGHRQAQLMIRHPNNSGLQMDQVSRLYIPAHYIETLRVTAGDALVFSAEAGISISEDPNFRFDYVPSGAQVMHVEAKDSTGAVFAKDWPLHPLM